MRSLPQNGSPSTRKNGDPNTPLRIASSFSSIKRAFVAASCIPASTAPRSNPTAAAGVSGHRGIAGGATFQPVFAVGGFGERDGLGWVLLLDPIERPCRRQRMLGKVRRHFQLKPDTLRHARRVHLDHVFALERVLQRRLAKRLVDSAQQERAPSTGRAIRVHLHRRDEAIRRGEIEIEVDGHQEQPQPLAPAALASASCWQQASASAGAGPPQQPALSLEAVSGTAANARLRQHQLDPLGRFLVAGDVGNDRAHLLIAGHHQERRRAAVGLHAGEVEAGLGLRQLARAMRTHRAAAVQIGIDQRRQDGRAFERRVERDAQLAQEGQIRPEAGCDDQLVGFDVAPATSRAGAEPQFVASWR